jgi:NADH dehydrogenase/NADH:ubiquinone reductase (non-electrogenic)
MLKRLSSSVRGFATKKIDERSNIVIIGAGWAGYRLALDLDKKKYNVKLISPRNHFLFTPLLPSTAVGTLEFRAIQEPVRTIPNLTYYQANAESINLETSSIHCTDIFKEYGCDFDVKYDMLVLAAGSETNTFGIKGVSNNNYDIFYLKQLSHARAIRNRLVDCFERASSPGIDEASIDRLLTFVVVGGGPTNVEFAAELYDFLKNDVSRWYPDLYIRSKVKMIELSPHILGSFDASLVSYVESLFASRNIEMMTNTGIKVRLTSQY